jgi:CHASE3 domain sensor protein
MHLQPINKCVLPKQFRRRHVTQRSASMHSTARSLILSRPAVVATLLVSLGLVVASVTLSTFSTHEISAADREAARAQHTLVVVNQLLATITEAETAQRGYILTHDEKYLAPYEAARPRYHVELDALNAEFADDPERTPLLTRLSTLCDERFAEIARTIELRREHGIASALNVVESNEGLAAMAEIRSLVQELQKYELGQISAHTATAMQRASTFHRLNGGILAFAVILGGAAAYLVIRRLHQLEGLIKICAWTKRVQWEGQWITFEEYLAKRFNLHCTHGISEEAAEQMSHDIANTPVPSDMRRG